MQNDFEKNINQRMQDFSIPPQPEIWQQVEAALPPEKKRRFALWWLLPLAGLLGTSIWLGKNNHVSDAGKQTVTRTATFETLPGQTNPASIKKATSADSSIYLPASSSSNDSVHPLVAILAEAKKTVVEKNKRSFQDQFFTHKKNTDKAPLLHSTSNYRFEKQNTLQPTVKNNQADEANKTGTPQKTDGTAGTLTANSLQPEDSTLLRTPVSPLSSSVNPTSNDTLQQTAAVKDTIPAANSNAGNAALKSNAPGTSGKKKSVEWHLQAGIGKSDIDGDNYKFVSSNSQYYNPSTGISTGSGTLYANSFLRAQTGLSFSAGVARRQYFNTHWSWQLSLRYQLLTSTQATGGNDTAVGRNNIASSTYNTGLAINRSSHTHQLQVLPHIGYTIPAGSALSLTLYAGLAAGYNFSTNQILSDYRTNTYIRSGYYTNKWYAAIDGGLELSWRKKIYGGFQYQQSVTNIAKSALGSDFRWQHWQAYISLPLFNHSSK